MSRSGRLRELGVEPVLGGDVVPVQGLSAVVKSPGVPSQTDQVVAARAAGVPVWSEVELAARMLPNPIAGVTGTNGKTTTTELLGAMLRSGGLACEVAGNVGRPLSALAGRVDPNAWIACELSSFQLEDIDTLRCRIGVALNLTPDHLDRHGTVEEYLRCKLRIFENQRPGDVAIVNGDDPTLRDAELPGLGDRVVVTREQAKEIDWERALLRGDHNLENALAAAAAARAAGVRSIDVDRALREFAPLPHRLEPVATAGGVEFVNDSKATNPDATIQALTAFPGAVHLILGGSLKGSDFTDLATAVAGSGPSSRTYLIGAAADAIAASLDAAGVAFERCGHAGTLPSTPPPPRPGPATRSCCRPRARASTSSGTTRTAATRSAAWRRRWPVPPEPPPKPRRRPPRRTAPPVHVEYHLLLLLTLGLVAFGLIMVYSASSGVAVVQGHDPLGPLVRQGSYALAGLICMAGAARISYRHLRVAGPFLMLAALIGLVLVKVPGIGIRVNGAERWIAAGPITIQSSEFAKLAVVVFAAAVLAARKRPPRTVKELANPIGVLALVICALVALEPDLGTTIAIAITITGMLIVAGTPLRLLAGTFAVLGTGAAFVISQNAYMHARLLAFMHPFHDAGGSGYQNAQALIALGSGGIWGKGLGQGTQKIFYLPGVAVRHDRRRDRRGAGPGRHPRDRARIRRLCLPRVPDRASSARPVREVPRRRRDLPRHRPGGREPRARCWASSRSRACRCR